MANERLQRRVTAILAADIAGYSRLMGADDAGTLARLKGHRAALIDPKIAEYQGRIVKTTGDGLLVEFASVVDALGCAVEIQRGMLARNAELPSDGRAERQIDFRIGINTGDIIIDGDDIYGDGVNVAARLENLAEPGGICVSARVQEDTRGKLEVVFEDMGEQWLKNIAWPVRVYRVQVAGDAAEIVHADRAALAFPDRASIAVLPFENMSGDHEQDYFADGMVEEIITALSRMRWLFVIARNSSFMYKGRAVDVKQVGRELGVRYVLEGSVRKAGNRVRISGQLVDTSTGAHLWADRFDGALEDIFEFQDQVTASVVGAIAPKLEQAEIERAKRKPPDSLDAYDYFLRGMAGVHRWTREANNDALRMFYRAIELDPNFAPAYGLAARCYSQRKASGWMVDRAKETAETVWLTRQAGQLGKDDAVVLCTAGIGLAYVVGDLDGGIAYLDRALELNPNLAWGWLYRGWMKVWAGEPEVGLEHVARALRLSPQDPQSFNMKTAIAMAHFFAGRDAEAWFWGEQAVREQPNFVNAMIVAAASAAMVGRMDEAGKALAQLLTMEPRLCPAEVKNLFPLRRPEDVDRLTEALCKAGLPAAGEAAG